MRLWLAALLSLAACSHSPPTAYSYAPLGPFGSGSDVQLTFNPRPDYDPSWAADGRSILYTWSPPVAPHDTRCLGLLPADGGTRLWSFCDDGFTELDSATSFGGAALGAGGALLYLEAASHLEPLSNFPRPGFDRVALFLTDTAHPLVRHTLATFPTFIGSTRIDWLERLSWTGDSSLAALADTITVKINEGSIDTLRYPIAVVTGRITANGATLQLVAGTLDARDYSMAGSNVVFSTGGVDLFTVPLSGGQATKFATVPPDTSLQLLDLSCQTARCILLTTQFRTIGVFPVLSLTFALRSLDIASGTSAVLEYRGDISFATPRIAPSTGDVVLDVGTSSGHDLHLYKGILP